MKRITRTVLLALVISYSVYGILKTYSLSPTLVAMVENVFSQKGIPYARPSIKETVEVVEVEVPTSEPPGEESEEAGQAVMQTEQERVHFKEDLDSFYTLATQFEKKEEEINTLYKDLLSRWKDDPLRKRALDKAYNEYLLIDLTWGV